MPIKSGIGFGEAQVYNTSGITNLYGKLLQQQSAQEAKFAGDLADVMSKYSTKGLRDEDIKLTAKAYQQIKDNVSKLSTRNPVERAKAIAQAQSGMKAIQEYADSALNAYKTLDQLSPDIMNNPWKYKEGTGDAIKSLYQLPYEKWGDDYKGINQSTFQRQPDNSSIYQMFNNVNSDLAKLAPVSGKPVDNVTGKHITTYFNVPLEEAKKNLYTTMELNPQAKYTLTSMYQQANPDKKDFTSADVADFGLKLYQQQYGDNAFKFYGGRTPISKEKKEEEGSDKLTYRQQLISGIINQDNDYRQELEANLPPNSKIQYGVSKAVPGVSKGGYKFVKIRIPAESTENGIEINETIPLEAGKPIQKLNYIINQYSPEKVSPSKVGITGGKPRGEKFELPTSNKKEILPTVSSEAEYNKLKKGQKYLSADGTPHIKK